MARFTCIPQLGKRGGGVVWDKESGTVLCQFDKNGICKTDDPAMIDKLRAIGFQELPEPAPDAPKPAQQAKPGRKAKTE